MLQTLKQWLLKKPTKIVLGVYVFYALFSLLAINPLAKQLVPWVAKKQLASQATVERVRFNPFIFSAEIDKLRLSNLQGKPLAGFEKLKVDLELSGIFNWAWKLKEISLQAPQGVIAIGTDGKLNWDDLIAKLNEDKSPPSDSIPRVVIQRLVIQQGQVLYKDANRAKAFQANLTPLNFELDGFSTLPEDRGDYLIAAKFADHGGTLKWKGNMGVNPVASKGDIALEGVALASLMQVLKDSALPFKLQQGTLQAHFGYDLTTPNDQPNLALNGVAIEIDGLAGAVNGLGDVSLQQFALHTPRITLSAAETTQLNVQGLAITLNDLQASNAQATTVGLAHIEVTLPQLNLVQGAHTQVQFEQLALKGNDLRVQNGQSTLFQLPSIAAQDIKLDLVKRQASVALVQLRQGAVSAKRARDGQLDWQTAFATPTAEPQQAPAADTGTEQATPIAVSVDAVQLQDWKLNVEDQTFTRPLSLDVQDIDIGFSVNNPEGQWSIQQLQTQLNALTLKSGASKKHLATLNQIQLTEGEIGIDKQQVSIQSIVATGLKTEVLQPKTGSLNWLTVLESHASQSAKSSASKSASNTDKSDWTVTLAKLALNNSQLHIEDQTPNQPVLLDIEKLGVELRNLSLNLARAVPMKASFTIKQGGRFETQGTLNPAPFKSALNLKLTDAAFKPFAPYLNQQAKLELASGTASLSGKLNMQQQKAFGLNFEGGFNIKQLALNEEVTKAPFLTWQQLTSDDLTLSLAPNRLHMGALKVQQPTGKFIIYEDKTTNISRILRSSDNAPPPADTLPTKAVQAKPSNTTTSVGLLQSAASTSQPSVSTNKTLEVKAPDNTTPTTTSTSDEAFPVNIASTRIQDAELEFADLSLTPQFGTKIHSLTGVINSISTNPQATAQLELDGKVDDYGAAKIRGSLQPFQATEFTDVKLAFTNLEMNRLTPYSGKFAGRRIDSGKLSVDLEYKIKQRQLAGENKFIINKLILGERVDSKDAADLPLDLAIAILEDSDGLIDLDLPISGSLDDPQFSYGSIVWKAIKNVLTKIVTSPFRALGKLFGGSGENLDAIIFEAGQAKLAPPEQEKLKAVSQALSKRQGLALTVAPSYDVALDTRAIQEQTLRTKVAEEMGVTLEADQKAGPIDLTNPKVQKAIDSLHDELTNKGLLKRLKDKFEKPPAGHYEAAQEKLTQSIEVKESDLIKLAQMRGEAIRESLTTAGIDTQRVRIEKAVMQKTSDKKANTTQTKLSLEVNKSMAKAETSETKPN
jgi:hypothetical protein